MTELARWGRTGFPDVFDWLESPLAAWSPFAAPAIRVEDYVQDDRYVVRADLPGLDPDKDIEITVADGTLTIHAERHEERRDVHRSEFRYGTLTRTLALPSGVNTEDIQARYANGILEVSVAMSGTKPTGRRIMVEQES